MFKIKVAIVEDDKDIRSSMTELLSMSHELNCLGAFERAEDFIKCFNELTVDVVLMDITLPGMNGIQCVRQ